MIDVVLLLVILLVTLVPIIVIVGFLLNKSSYRNTVWIARQTGKDVNDVIWIQDRFKVQFVDGQWNIRFYKMKEASQSVNGKFWTKILKKNSNTDKKLGFSKEVWDSLDMRHHLKRGLFLYETTEGEFYPLPIRFLDDKPIFTPFDQDNRTFIAQETQNINALTRNKSSEKLMMWIIIVGIIGLVVVGGLMTYFQNKSHEENIVATANLCGQYTVNIVNALTNSSTKPQFINDIKNNIVNPGG